MAIWVVVVLGLILAECVLESYLRGCVYRELVREGRIERS